MTSKVDEDNGDMELTLSYNLRIIKLRCLATRRITQQILKYVPRGHRPAMA